MHYIYFIKILIFPLILSRDFKNPEIQVALEIFKELKIFHCVIIIENSQSILLNQKEIYNYNIFINYVQNEYLHFFVNNTESFYMKTGFVVNINAIDILKDLFDKDPVKVSKFTWMIFAEDNVGLELNIPYNCEFVTAELGKNNEYLLKEIYYVKSSGPFFVDFGIWSGESGLVLNDKFSKQRKDMRGVALVRGDSYGFVKGKTCNNFTIERLHREIWVEYARLLNFSLVIENEGLSNDPMSPDGTPCAMAQHSLNYFPDAVYPTCFGPLYMVIKFESDLGEGWKAYFKPFSPDIWWSLSGFLTVFIGAFIIVGYFTNTIFYMNPFAVFYSFCYQDGIDLNNERLTKLSSLILYLMPHLAATVIVPAYSAAILAKLTVQLPKVPFTDLNTFAQDGTYKIASLNKTFVNMYFMRSQHPLISKIYKEMFMNENEYPNIDSEAINKLCSKEKFAYIPYYLENLNKNSHCKLFKISKVVLHLYCGFRMKVKSPFKQVFSQLLIGLYSSGLISRKNDTLDGIMLNSEETLEPIEITQIFPILNLIPIGMFLGFVCLVIEIFIRKRKSGRRVFAVSKRPKNLLKYS